MAKQIDPSDHNTAAAFTSLLDANAEEWLRGANAQLAHDGRFKG